MAQVQFPSSPSDGDQYTVNDVTYTWNNTAGLWEANNASALADRFVEVPGDTMTGGLNFNDGSTDTIQLGTDGTAIFDADVQSASQNGGPLAGFRNQLINGDMRQWQRGANIASPSQTNTYTADRWYAVANAGNTEVKRVRNGPAGFSFCMQTNGSISNIQQGVELTAAGEPGRFAIGTTWTLSVWSTYNLAGTTTFFNFRDEVGEPTNSVTAASPAAPAFASTGETSNGFTRYSATFSVNAAPASTNTNGNILIRTGNTAGAQFTGCQLEPGPVATPFEHRPVGTELALCQRYFAKFTSRIFLTMTNSTGVSNRVGNVFYPTTMRVTPTAQNLTFSGATTLGFSGNSTLNSGYLTTSNGTSGNETYTTNLELAAEL
jgi:hypothetical protein